MQIALKGNLSKSQKSEIVAAYHNLVKKIAVGLSRKSVDPVEDLIQVGFIGLLEAAENFKEIHKTLFKTYATHYISGHIRHYLRDKQSLLRGPRSLQELSYKASQAIKDLSQKLGREPNDFELSEILAISKNKLEEVKSYQKRISLLWFDQTSSYDDDKGRAEDIIDEKNNMMNEYLEDKIILKHAFEKLDPKDKRIIELRYFEEMTQSEIAKIFNVSQMDISRKLKKAEKELRRYLNS